MTSPISKPTIPRMVNHQPIRRAMSANRGLGKIVGTIHTMAIPISKKIQRAERIPDLKIDPAIPRSSISDFPGVRTPQCGHWRAVSATNTRHSLHSFNAINLKTSIEQMHTKLRHDFGSYTVVQIFAGYSAHIQHSLKAKLFELSAQQGWLWERPKTG